ncbi:MAG TPA: glycerol-3-phosphate acyltransferase [Acidimicrobiia bacterium]|nr:glycerol-3-phosphate acyltransferase [Acidimicrobiia bacterium]
MAVALGYLIGSIPTAGWLARRKGIDLRTEGSGNPGTKNALGTGGPRLAAAVLVVEATKGFGAVCLGSAMGADIGAVAAGIGAVAGNVFNIWYRFEGGKGLGISLGVLAGLWPVVLPVILVVIIVAAVITRSAGLAALAAMAALLGSALVWAARDWPTFGLASTGPQLIVFSLAVTAVMAWKHGTDSPLNPAWNSSRRTAV